MHLILRAFNCEKRKFRDFRPAMRIASEIIRKLLIMGSQLHYAFHAKMRFRAPQFWCGDIWRFHAVIWFMFSLFFRLRFIGSTYWAVKSAERDSTCKKLNFSWKYASLLLGNSQILQLRRASTPHSMLQPRISETNKIKSLLNRETR